MPERLPKQLEDAFIKVSFEEDKDGASTSAYEQWIEKGSGIRPATDQFTVHALRKAYPDHSVVFCQQNLLAFPDTFAMPLKPEELIAETVFIPLARKTGIPGILAQQVQYGGFQMAWDNYEFIVYVARFPLEYRGYLTYSYILYQGSEEPAGELVLAAGAWADRLHEQILMFNDGYWQKNHELWVEIQKAQWSDVIMKQEFKDTIQKDIYGFFKSEQVYKNLSIPWKRGIIMHGPPGNGKTISIKAIMKECESKGFAPLYVKSFRHWAGEEAGMRIVFQEARRMSPCVLILEDLDSLITDSNRSFFLNELDGFEGNDGILVIGTTNHLTKLDPALSTRPSRFDRKYLFDDPDLEERSLYAKYWQKKLASNDKIDFPNSLVKDVAEKTDKFSFAYLKEAFVSTLFLIATSDDKDESDFSDVLLATIASLKKQLDKPAQSFMMNQGLYTTSNPGAASWMNEQPKALKEMQEARNQRSLALTAASLGRMFI